MEVELGGARSAAALLTRASRETAQVQPPSPARESAVNWLREEFSANGLADEVGRLASADGKRSADGRGAGDGNGDGFFGARMTGRRFVFVVDCSRSMNHPHKSEAKTRFRRLQLELLNSISAMQPDEKFFIVFFNDRVIPMPASSLQPATRDRQKHFLHWMTRVRADGDTDPRSALRLALKLRPDVIYFLTDGSFERPIQRDLERLHQDRVAIHTFAFGNRAAQPLLKSIAVRNAGEYHFIP